MQAAHLSLAGGAGAAMQAAHLSLAGQGARWGEAPSDFGSSYETQWFFAPTGRKVIAQGKAKRRPGFASSRYEMQPDDFV